MALSRWEEGTDTEQALRSGSPGVSTVISKERVGWCAFFLVYNFCKKHVLLL